MKEGEDRKNTVMQAPIDFTRELFEQTNEKQHNTAATDAPEAPRTYVKVFLIW